MISGNDENDAATNQAATGRRLVRSMDSGILSSMSLELPGYPFGSVAPYVMTHDGALAMYVSSIAQHTRNMQEDPKVSLTIVQQGLGNKQALGRVTVVGDARRPVVRALDPRTHDEVDAAVGQLGTGDGVGGVGQDASLGLEDALDDGLGLDDVVAIADAEDHVDPARLPGRKIRDRTSGDLAVGPSGIGSKPASRDRVKCGQLEVRDGCWSS